MKEEINKLEVIRAALDCENTAMMFVVDNEGHMSFIATGNNLDKKNPEANVASFLFDKLCDAYIEAMNWQSKKLEENEVD
jgi:hypothetical protein